MAKQAAEEVVSDKILTVPNVITLVRCLLIPLFLWLEFGPHLEIAALVVFAVAAATDWVDGQVARRTNQVSKLGKLFDPLVDRLLLAAGVIAVCILGRLPIWILVLLVVRDALLLAEGKLMLSTVGKVPAVVYIGKFATAFLMFGYCFLLLGMPSIPGIGLLSASVSWLPGLGGEPALFGIWLIYIGIILSIVAFVVYQVKGAAMYVSWSSYGKQSEHTQDE